MFEVYRHTSPSGKSYVGWTSVGWQKRWRKHIVSSHLEDTAFSRAIRKYGADAFTHEVLERMTTEAGAKRAEQLWIRELGTRSNGYNSTDGGDGVLGLKPMLGKKHSPETRARMSAAQKNRVYVSSIEARKKISAAHTGRRLSEDTKAKISASSRGHKKSAETRARMSRARTGVKHSAERLANMSAAIQRQPSEVRRARARRAAFALWAKRRANG